MRTLPATLILVVIAALIVGCIPQEGLEQGGFVAFVQIQGDRTDGMVLVIDPADLHSTNPPKAEGWANKPETIVSQSDNPAYDGILSLFTDIEGSEEYCFKQDATFQVDSEIVGRIPAGTCLGEHTGPHPGAITVDFDNPIYAP